MFTLISAVPPNELLPSVVTVEGIVKLVRLVQPANALLPIEVTAPSIVMLSSEVQL